MSRKAKVLYDFKPQAENQISLKTGQVISIVHDGGKGGWSKGIEEGTGDVNLKYLSLLIL
jgi:hypothetical protein